MIRRRRGSSAPTCVVISKDDFEVKDPVWNDLPGYAETSRSRGELGVEAHSARCIGCECNISGPFWEHACERYKD